MDTRERLLDAAIRLLEEKGYARTTTRQIVAAADSHLPAVNYYFGSKERLLEEAIVEALRRWAQTTMAVAEEPGPLDPAERLRRSIERFFATLEADRPYVVAALEAFAQAERSDALRARLAEAYQEFREVVASSVERAAAHPEVPPVSDTAERSPDPDVTGLASTLMALFDGLAIQWLLDPEGAPSAEQAVGSLAALGQVFAPPATRAL